MRGMLRNVLTGTMVLGVASVAFGADEDLKSELEALRQKVDQQEQKIQELQARDSESWLNQRRKEEVKTLVKDVLNDADTRASLQGEGMNAGYEDHFYISSGDGNFLMQITGHSQTRYIYNNSDQPDGQREHQEGFQQRRARLGFFGHVYDPAIQYGLSFRYDEGDLGFSGQQGVTGISDVDSTGGGSPTDVDDPADIQTTTATFGSNINLENAFVAYEFADGWNLQIGQFKAPFLREEDVDSSQQLAVERSVIADLYTVDYTQGAQLSYTADMLRLKGMVHDGSYAANTDFDSTAEREVALAGRAEVLLAGEWSQFDDFTTWTGDTLGIMAGIGGDWEIAEGETGNTGSDVLKWTADLSMEVPEAYGFNAFGALIGNHLSGSGETGTAGADQYAAVAQAGVFIVPDKLDGFVRWEFVDLDGASPNGFALPARSSDKIHALTFGSNYYIREHAAKASLDLVWYLEPTGAPGAVDPIGSNTGAGVLSSQGDDQFALRGQFQFQF